MGNRETEAFRRVRKVLERADETCREAEAIRVRVMRSLARSPLYPERRQSLEEANEPPDHEQSA